MSGARSLDLPCSPEPLPGQCRFIWCAHCCRYLGEPRCDAHGDARHAVMRCVAEDGHKPFAAGILHIFGGLGPYTPGMPGNPIEAAA